MKLRRQFLKLSIVIISFVSVLGYVYYNVMQWEKKAYPNSYIGSMGVSGMSANEVRHTVEAYFNKSSAKKVTTVYENKTYSAGLEELRRKEDIDKIVEDIMAYGKNLNMFQKFGLLRRSPVKNYEVKIKYDQKAVKAFVERVKNDINKAAANAYISDIVNGKPVCVKEVKGKAVNEEQLINDIISNNDYNSGDAKIAIKVSEISPEVREDMLKPIDTLLASFSTNYLVSALGRAENIALAASKLNGTILMPGEEFSFNKMTGPRTLENGFKGAPVIINDKLVDGVAGGVCQVSTTLHNAVVKLGIKPTRRLNHSLAPAYVGLGFDATVSDLIDYRFRNTLKYPLYIQAKAQGGRLTFNLYSNSSVSSIKYALVNEIVETLEPKTIYNAVDTIPSGSVEKVQEPIKGYKVKVYLVGYKDGKEISRELLYNDSYNKVDEVFNIGI
ncbi:MAG: VanW family protein [Bacillota bacterium]|nr:VanW family protein [Bacillota bacterium]